MRTILGTVVVAEVAIVEVVAVGCVVAFVVACIILAAWSVPISSVSTCVSDQ